MAKRERIIAIIAAAVIGLLLLDQVMISPWLERLGDADRRIAQDTAALARASQMFDNSLRAQRNWREMAGTTLPADAPTAESQVLNRVQDWTRSTGISLTSSKPERAEQERDFYKITIRATATGTMAQISRFLYAVQTTDIPLRITDIQIASRRDGADDLSLQIGLATLYLPPAQQTAGAMMGGGR